MVASTYSALKWCLVGVHCSFFSLRPCPARGWDKARATAIVGIGTNRGSGVNKMSIAQSAIGQSTTTNIRVSPMPTVLVVGAGPSGLVTIKEMVEGGMDVTCFEACESLGGVFARTYERLR